MTALERAEPGQRDTVSVGDGSRHRGEHGRDGGLRLRGGEPGLPGDCVDEVLAVHAFLLEVRSRRTWLPGSTTMA